MQTSEHGHGKSQQKETLVAEQATLTAMREEANTRHEKAAHVKAEVTYESMGEELGWHNTTSDPDKVADVEILSVTGYNVEFLKMHHRVRDLLEVNARWGGELFTMIGSSGEPEAIYQKLAGRSPMKVELLNEQKEPTGVYRDLREMAQLLKMEEYNKYLGSQKFSTTELRRRFFANESLVKMVEGKETNDEKEVETVEAVDLRDICPKDDMKDFDFKKYIKLIQNEQIGFQRLGVTRDQALTGHHVENGSHTLFVKTGNTKSNGNPEYLWMPTCATWAINDARADLPKKGSSFRAEGHVHEVASGYDEQTSITVGFNVDLLRRHRGDIQLKDHNKTNVRMNHAAVGLGPKEEMMILRDEEKTIKRGGRSEKFRGTIAVIGGKRKGKVYTGLHNTYDKAMEEVRGFKLTDEEADDLIFTDIVAPFIYANSADWLMCFANSTSNLNYIPQKAMLKTGEEWGNYGSKGGQNFCVAIPCRKEDADEPQGEGLKYFFEYNDLIDYVNKRIKEGDLGGVNPENQLSRFSGMTQKQIDMANEESDTQDEDEKNPFDEMDPTALQAIKGLNDQLFGADYEAVWKEFVVSGAKAKVSIGGKTEVFIDYVEKKLKQNSFDEIKIITGTADVDAGRKKMLEIFRRMTGPLRKEVLEYSRTGKQSERQKGELDKKTVELIILQEASMGDWVKATSLCWKFLADKPEFAGFKTEGDKRKDKGKKNKDEEVELQKIKATPWGPVVHRVAKIIATCRNQKNKEIKDRIGDKVNDPKWLLREAAIQIGEPDLLKEIEK